VELAALELPHQLQAQASPMVVAVVVGWNLREHKAQAVLAVVAQAIMARAQTLQVVLLTQAAVAVVLARQLAVRQLMVATAVRVS
jgi:hypothetical protein